jgi:prephenate dehydrogenase
METVAIIGVGLIGGSFALAIRDAGFRGSILGVSSSRTLETALAMGVIDEPATLESAVGRADVVYLAQPILTIIETLGKLDGHVRPGALITDVGSTKSCIMRVAQEKIRRGIFVGGHPMAGKETRGVTEAEAGLFRGRPYVITPSNRAHLEDPLVMEFLDYVERIGANQVVLDAGEHDRMAAYVSHMPQMVSTALAAVLREYPEIAVIAGPAARELTRIAASPYDIWRDILVTNPAPIRAGLDAVIDKLKDLRDKLTSEEMKGEFANAGEGARMLRSRPESQNF